MGKYQTCGVATRQRPAKPTTADADPVPWLDAAEMRAWRGFLLAHSRLERVLTDDLQTDHGVQLSDHEVLIHLSEAPGGRLRMRELADKLLMSRSGLTRRIDGMVAEELVARVRCSGDARGVEASITAAGRNLLARISPSHVGTARRQLVDRFSPGELRTLAGLVARIAPEASGDAADGDGTCGGMSG